MDCVCVRACVGQRQRQSSFCRRSLRSCLSTRPFPHDTHMSLQTDAHNRAPRKGTVTSMGDEKINSRLRFGVNLTNQMQRFSIRERAHGKFFFGKGKKPLEVIGRTFCLSRFSTEPISTCLSLPIGGRGDTRRASLHRGEPRCTAVLSQTLAKASQE